MPRWLQLTVFLLVMLTVYGGAHFYLYRRLLAGLGTVSPRVRLGLRVAAVLLALSFPGTRMLVSLIGLNPLTVAADWAAAVWMGLFFYLFVLTLAFQLIGLLLRWLRLRAPLGRTLGGHEGRLAIGLVVALALGIGGWGYGQAARGIVTSEVEVTLPGLPAKLDGFELVAISDLHIGALVGIERLERMVAAVNAHDPDAIVLVGDVADEDAAHLAEVSGRLAHLRARHGVFAVSGNHDWYAGIDAVAREAAQGGVRFLRNESVLLGEGLRLYGREDRTAKTMAPERFWPLERLIGPEAREEASVLLYHQPLEFDEAAARGVDLMLSGHTHKGQIWPFTYLSRIAFPRNAGLYRHGESFLYVSRGIGTWGPPMRVLSPPEVVRIVLRSPKR